MIRIENVGASERLFNYQLGFDSPYFDTDYNNWEKSFAMDVDGEGRTLFRKLEVKAAYDGTELIGFIQYGNTAFGFDERGEISSDVTYCVIRNLFFDKGREDAGKLLLADAINYFKTTDGIYAYFHYFGMSCFGRHGKLYEKNNHIEELLRESGFEIEHENVYYSSLIDELNESEVEIKQCDLTNGNQQYMDFRISDESVGGCEIHYVNNKSAYLRWIYINDNITGKGIGTKCMDALKSLLYKNGFTRFDTDTAISNEAACHFYEKNGFVREGITRSFKKK